MFVCGVFTCFLRVCLRVVIVFWKRFMLAGMHLRIAAPPPNIPGPP
jgi:hypothetical protein